MIEVLQPGLATTVQDEGRPGYYKLGMSPAGALDLESYRVGNGLVGNPAGLAGLEITYAGPKLRFSRPGLVAVTGADLPMQVDGEPVPSWQPVPVAEGSVVSFGYLKAGARAYLSIRGGIEVPKVLGSRATHVLTKIGGFEGRPLRIGDTLTIGSLPDIADRDLERRLDPSFVPQFSGIANLRIVLGLFSHRLTKAAQKMFVDTAWTVSPNADRTGFRMVSDHGKALEFVPREQPFGAGSDPSNVVDAGYPIGSIQIPSGTEPIVLHRDAVTAGGYFTVGAVISADLDRLGQCATNASVRLEAVTIEQAIEARRARSAHIRRVLETLA